MRDDSMSCEALQQALHEDRELTKAQAAHIHDCDTCMDTWLTAALDEKPDVPIPGDFAARVAANLPSSRGKYPFSHRPRHWGLVTAIAVVTLLLVVCFMGSAPSNSTASSPTNSWIGLAFMFLISAEIAGLALWLGPRWTGR
jgi:hypothetical protein